jgi:hypothetical protein
MPLTEPKGFNAQPHLHISMPSPKAKKPRSPALVRRKPKKLVPISIQPWSKVTKYKKIKSDKYGSEYF